MLRQLLLLGLLCAGGHTQYFGDYYCQDGRDVAVHLFEWGWNDIASECSQLADWGFCAVQVREHGLWHWGPDLSKKKLAQVLTYVNNLGNVFG